MRTPSASKKTTWIGADEEPPLPPNRHGSSLKGHLESLLEIAFHCFVHCSRRLAPPVKTAIFGNHIVKIREGKRRNFGELVQECAPGDSSELSTLLSVSYLFSCASNRCWRGEGSRASDGDRLGTKWNCPNSLACTGRRCRKSANFGVRKRFRSLQRPTRKPWDVVSFIRRLSRGDRIVIIALFCFAFRRTNRDHMCWTSGRSQRHREHTLKTFH